MRFGPTWQDGFTSRLFDPRRGDAGCSKSDPRHLQGFSPSWRLEKGTAKLMVMFQTKPAFGFSLQSFDPSAKPPALSGILLSYAFNHPVSSARDELKMG
jgi:hypothetical protein